MESERQPLLPQTEDADSSKTEETPLPKLQISILLLLQLAEPLTSQVIYPFINQLVRDLDITGGDPRKVGYYAGLIVSNVVVLSEPIQSWKINCQESLFFAVEACVVFAWNRTSDRIGRKPVLLMGLAGISVSMTLFGLSKTYLTLVLSRCLTGMTNGNVGVIKTMMGEISDSTNVARAFSFMSIIWCLGGTIGPFAGGSLSRPHDRFPEVFRSQFWADYPYLLPCLFSASFAVVAFIITLIFLKETIPKSYNTDSELTYDSSPRNAEYPSDEPIPIRDLLTRPILLSIANYSLVGLAEICFVALQPLFYYTPIENGGLGFDISTIGLCISLFGVTNGILQIVLFPKAIARFGPQRVLAASQAVLIPMLALFPLINHCARQNGISTGVLALLSVQLSLAIVFYMSYGSVFMFIMSSAPTKRSLGSVNGMSQTVVSIIRTFGPASSTSLFAYSHEKDLLGGNAVYLIVAIVPMMGFILASKLPRKMWNVME